MIEIISYIEIGERIEDIVYELDVDYMDACMVYCQRNNLEIEFLGALIKKNPYIKGKIQEEAEDLNFMKKSTRLEL
jgi:Phage late-transcription coactivator